MKRTMNPSMALVSLLVPAVLLLAAVLPALAQEPGANFPNSGLGKLGQQLIEAINSGDPATQVRFVRNHVSSAALKEIPVEQRTTLLTTIFRQSGGLDVRKVSGTGVLEIVVRTRRGGSVHADRRAARPPLAAE